MTNWRSTVGVSWHRLLDFSTLIPARHLAWSLLNSARACPCFSILPLDPLKDMLRLSLAAGLVIAFCIPFAFAQNRTIYVCDFNTSLKKKALPASPLTSPLDSGERYS